VSCLKSAGQEDDARLDFQVVLAFAVMGVASPEKRSRDDEAIETSLNGDVSAGIDRSWSMSSDPTKPAPTTATRIVGGCEDIAKGFLESRLEL